MSISAGNFLLLVTFFYITGGVGGLFDSFNSLHHIPCLGTPSKIVGASSSF
jgi:hypothetical protein